MSAKAPPTATAYSNAIANVEAHWSMEVEETRKRSEISILESEHHATTQRISELANAALGYRKDKDGRPHLQDELTAARGEAASIREEIETLLADVDESKRRRAGTKIEVTPAVVARHQEVLTAAAAAVESMHQRRSEIVARLNTAPAPNPVAKLLCEREDLLAALALGEPRESDLSSLDDRINAASAEAAPAMAAAEAAATADRQALSGIDRRSIVAAEDLRRLRRAAPVLLGHLLVTDMRETAARYESAAQQAAAALLRLKALDDLRQANTPGVSSGLSMFTVQQAMFPMPLGDPPVLNYQSMVGNVAQNLTSAKNEEIARLAALGVAIP